MGRLRTDGGSLLSFAKIHPPSAMANRGEKDHGSYENYEWTGVEKLNLPGIEVLPEVSFQHPSQTNGGAEEADKFEQDLIADVNDPIGLSILETIRKHFG